LLWFLGPQTCEGIFFWSGACVWAVVGWLLGGGELGGRCCWGVFLFWGVRFLGCVWGGGVIRGSSPLCICLGSGHFFFCGCGGCFFFFWRVLVYPWRFLFFPFLFFSFSHSEFAFPVWGGCLFWGFFLGGVRGREFSRVVWGGFFFWGGYWVVFLGFGGGGVGGGVLRLSSFFFGGGGGGFFFFFFFFFFLFRVKGMIVFFLSKPPLIFNRQTCDRVPPWIIGPFMLRTF